MNRRLFTLLACCLALSTTALAKHERPTITSEAWGTADGKPVYLYSLRNANGILLKITNYGGIITELHAPDRHGHVDNIVLGLNSLEAYQKGHPCFGSTVGRYIDRIGNASFPLDGREYQLTRNCGKHSIHGGKKNFYCQVWDSETATSHDAATLSLRYLSADMEEGFPGNLQVQVDFSLTADNELRIEYTATTDKPTIVNLSNHSYFNLSGGQEDVLGHEVRIRADKFLATDDDRIPTGDMEGTDGTPLDLRQWTRIGERMTQLPDGFDHCYSLKGKSGKKPRLAAELRDAKSGRLLQTYTTQPGLCFYTAKELNTKRNTTHGTPYGSSWGACLETEHFPDSPHHDNFPSTVLRPGETYHEVTVYKLRTF